MEPPITDLEPFEILWLFQVLVYRKTAANGRLSVLILIWLSFLVDLRICVPFCVHKSCKIQQNYQVVMECGERPIHLTTLAQGLATDVNSDEFIS